MAAEYCILYGRQDRQALREVYFYRFKYIIGFLLLLQVQGK